jgi:hypothetical protein
MAVRRQPDLLAASLRNGRADTVNELARARRDDDAFGRHAMEACELRAQRGVAWVRVVRGIGGADRGHGGGT